jgi:hypothetical protein
VDKILFLFEVCPQAVAKMVEAKGVKSPDKRKTFLLGCDVPFIDGLTRMTENP